MPRRILTHVAELTAGNGIILPLGAAASLLTPMVHADAEFIVDVFDGFIETNMLVCWRVDDNRAPERGRRRT
jgi:glutamate-1-semialdehyde 2,1-aminomutase